MNRWLAIVAFRCDVAGQPTDSIDIQVRYLEADSAEEIESRFRREPVHSYLNDEGDVVMWPLVDVLATAPISCEPDGSEVVGFVAGCHEFAKWAQGNA